MNKESLQKIKEEVTNCLWTDEEIKILQSKLSTYIDKHYLLSSKIDNQLYTQVYDILFIDIPNHQKGLIRQRSLLLQLKIKKEQNPDSISLSIAWIKTMEQQLISKFYRIINHLQHTEQPHETN